MLSLLLLRLPRVLAKVLLPLLLLAGLAYALFVHSEVGLLWFSEPLMVGAGHTLERGNVKFHFVDAKRKAGTPQEVLQKNNKIYDAVMAQKISEPKDYDVSELRPSENYQHANATILALVRNNEVTKFGKTIRAFERLFNGKFLYPYTIMNDRPFTESFKMKIKSYTNAPVNFVHIPPEYWDKPALVDTAREQEAMERLAKMNVMYAKKGLYHNMCRFYLRAFYNLPELQKYKYYWRIEPNVQFFSDIKYDVFKYLEKTEKIYGFTISLYDIDESIETLYTETLDFLNKDDNYQYVHPNGAFQFMTENQQIPKKAQTTGGYSTCHFWSNFEIADMDFYRGEAYTKWVDHLESTGKFYYERWGDAPVHSLGLALFADKRKVHWFRDIGYHHVPYRHCPTLDATRGCNPGQFSDGDYNLDQNCMATWIDYEMESPAAIY